MGARMHYENPRQAEFKVNPVPLLEKWGIDNFSINEECLTITVPDLDFKKVAFELGINIVSITDSFFAFGWKWQKTKK